MTTMKNIILAVTFAGFATGAWAQAEGQRSATPATGASFKAVPARGSLTNVQAVPSRPASPPTNRPFGLTESINPEQRTRLMEANAAMQKETQPLYLQMRQTRMELDQLVSTNNVSESAIRAKAAELGKLEGDLAMVRAKHQKTIRGFLSTNQVSTFQPPISTNLPQKRLNTIVNQQQTNPPQPAPKAAPVNPR